MEPLKIILLVITQNTDQSLIQKLAQKLEKLLLEKNLGHIQNLIISDNEQKNIDKKIEQMTNTNCEVLIVLNFSGLNTLPNNQFINHKLVLTIAPNFIAESLVENLMLHQKAMERSFGCKKGCQ